MTKAEFVARAEKAAVIAKAKGAIINTEAVIAQAALESGWGNSLLALKYNNLFGMKAGTLWTGPAVSLWTFEYWSGRYHKVMATWRVYPSWNECMVDYSRFIHEREWFKDAEPHADPPFGDGNAYGWIEKLVDSDYAGEYKWATAPDYVNKVMGRVAAEIAILRGEIK